MSANAKTMQLAPLSEEQTLQLQQLTHSLDVQALHWLAGYAVGRAHSLDLASDAQLDLPITSQTQPANQLDPSQQLTILYGSQTGNGQELAERYAADMQAAGVNVNLSNMLEYNVRKLKDEQHLLLVVSTHGDGDPPDDAVDFIEQLNGKKAPKLDHLSYSVLALGDSSYPDFCVTGQRIDSRLAELGAQRLVDCAQADLDIEEIAEPWWNNLQTRLRETLTDQSGAALSNVTPLRRNHTASTYNRKNPYQAELLTNQPITADSSSKDIRHVELDLGDSDLCYEPGDALGVWATNPQAIVGDVLQATGLSGDQPVSINGEEKVLVEWLSSKREITLLSRPFLQTHAEHTKSGDDRQNIEALLSDEHRSQLSGLFDSHQVVDALRRWPADWSAEALVNNLRPLTPRMYSIASSQAVSDDEVHTTLSRVAYDAHGVRHWGAASNYLANLDAEQQTSVPIFIDSNPRFRLPEDTDRDIIMVGPGTGIAPFRAFVQHRAATQSATKAAGRNWLFFGAQHFKSQFLYQLEWMRALKSNQLQRLDLAFSRDQVQKIYVQHRMLEQGKALYDWLENGAYFYVCGDAKYMAKDVEAALHQVVAKHGGKSDEQAAEYVRNLTRQKRLLKDVY